MLQTKTKVNRESRLQFRTTPQQKDLIVRAAARSNKTVSEFVLENVLEAAAALELDNAHFVVSREKYEAFLAKLDEPTKSKPNLRRLMTGKSVFDK